MPNEIKVAIVEDHEVTRLGLNAALSNETGLRIVGTTDSAAAGITLCQQTQPDVLLLDLHLPDSSNVASLITAFAPLCKHVIVLSSEARRPFVDSALSMNISGYLLKSEPVEVIVDAVRQVATGTSSVISRELDRDNVALTPAERHLLAMLAQGMKYEQMAYLRKTAMDTVRKQCERLLIKLDLGTREELISWAAQHGYADIDAGQFES